MDRKQVSNDNDNDVLLFTKMKRESFEAEIHWNRTIVLMQTLQMPLDDLLLTLENWKQQLNSWHILKNNHMKKEHALENKHAENKHVQRNIMMKRDWQKCALFIQKRQEEYIDTMLNISINKKPKNIITPENMQAAFTYVVKEYEALKIRVRKSEASCTQMDLAVAFQTQKNEKLKAELAEKRMRVATSKANVLRLSLEKETLMQKLHLRIPKMYIAWGDYVQMKVQERTMLLHNGQEWFPTDTNKDLEHIATELKTCSVLNSSALLNTIGSRDVTAMTNLYQHTLEVLQESDEHLMKTDAITIAKNVKLLQEKAVTTFEPEMTKTLKKAAQDLHARDLPYLELCLRDFIERPGESKYRSLVQKLGYK